MRNFQHQPGLRFRIIQSPPTHKPALEKKFFLISFYISLRRRTVAAKPRSRSYIACDERPYAPNRSCPSPRIFRASPAAIPVLPCNIVQEDKPIRLFESRLRSPGMVSFGLAGSSRLAPGLLGWPSSKRQKRSQRGPQTGQFHTSLRQRTLCEHLCGLISVDNLSKLERYSHLRYVYRTCPGANHHLTTLERSTKVRHLYPILYG